MELVLEVGYWLLRAAASHPRHVAAVLTATAIPVVVSTVLLDTGATSEAGTAIVLSAVIGGVALAVPAEGLGAEPPRWHDWVAVMAGAVVGSSAVLGFVVFFALFGTLAGLHIATIVAASWLVLRLGIALVGVARARSQSST